ncbi:hypothetical protein Scep_009056 [Stephania cephalantha]|uniref:GH16 domain-containing protein n=1 Tax=Stephania cephalantha TaxID=152367 RepID=A0AAP0PFX9_9MAGN
MEMMTKKYYEWVVGVILLYGFCSGSIVGVFGAAPKKAVDVPFQKNYVPSWSADHIKYINGGKEVQLLLDKYSGTGFQSRDAYLFGHFSMRIKTVPDDSAGIVIAFYLSSQGAEHDEIDFEILGNRTGQPSILQTNVFTGGKGDREQRIFFWFDPSKLYHTYSILWNMYMIAFFVDDVPIRVFKNSKDIGVRFPFNQPMKLYSSLWNADDWATRGGKEKTDWSKAPFTASYSSFHIDGCDAPRRKRSRCAQHAALNGGIRRPSKTLMGISIEGSNFGVIFVSRIQWGLLNLVFNSKRKRERSTAVVERVEIKSIREEDDGWRGEEDSEEEKEAVISQTPVFRRRKKMERNLHSVSFTRGTMKG